MTALTTPSPDEQGWTIGEPPEEGNYWFIAKNKRGAWAIYLGTYMQFGEDRTIANLHGYGSITRKEFLAVAYKPAELPNPPGQAIVKALGIKEIED